MRHFVLLTLALSFACDSVFATPVFLHLESRFASGHYPRKSLETKTRSVQFQRWFRVQTKDHAYGWLPEDHVVTPLKLAAQAILKEETALRTARDLNATSGITLPKNTRVLILETDGSWVRIRKLPASENPPAWVPSSSLIADLNQPAPKAFVPAHAFVYVLPGTHARIQARIREPRFVQILNVKNDWLEVRMGSVTTGFIRRRDVTLLSDLGPNGIQPQMNLTPLRSCPLPYADLVLALPATAKLRVLTARNLNWGHVQLRDLGDVWWPMAEEPEETRVFTASDRITTPQLFKRKIFDMATSPRVPALKFVSADGIFRTHDGREWNRIPDFNDKNYPLAVAGDGAVFVGPYLSEDHGETFREWIRWDILVSTLRPLRQTRGLRILDIRPQDASGQRVVLKLNVGSNQPIAVLTDDQGRSWRLVSL